MNMDERLEQAVYKSEYSNSHKEWRKSSLSSNQGNANYSELLVLHSPEWLKFKRVIIVLINMRSNRNTHILLSSVQSFSRVRLFVTPWNAARQASLSITNSRSSIRLNIHRVSDVIQPSHPLSSPSPLSPNPSQHQSLFQWVNSSHEVAKVLEFQLQHHSFQRTPRTDLL